MKTERSPGRRPLSAVRYSPASVRRVLRSVFFKLMVSYVFLVFIVAVGTSAVSYAFFQGRYNQELERIHLSMVRNIEEELSARVVDTSKRIYLECATELLRGSGEFFGEEDAADGNFVRLSATHRMLGELMGRYGDVLEGIALYYRKADLIMAFPSGVRFRASSGSPADYAPFGEFLAQDRNAVWNAAGERGPRTFRRFPILSTPADCTVVVSVSVRRDELRRIISSVSLNYAGETYILDAAGVPVEATAAGAPEVGLMEVFRELAGAPEKRASARIERDRRIGALVASVPISDTGWTLVNVTPISQLNKKGEALRAILAAICLAAVVLGIGVSALLTARVYNPLERLIGRVRRLFGAVLPPLAESAETADEYRLLDYAIEGLSSRMGELSATLARSRPLIKHELASALLVGDAPYLGDAEATLRALGIPRFPARSVACLIRVRTGRGDADDLENRLLRYRIAEELENVPDRFAMTTVFADGAIGAIVSLDPPPQGGLSMDRDASAAFVRDLAARFDASISVSAGTAADSPEVIRDSFRAAGRIAAYAYFFPERPLLAAADGFLEREGRSAELPAAVFEELADGARRGDGALVAAALQSAADFVRSDRASAEVCRRELARLSRALAAVQAESFPAAAADYRALAERTAAATSDIDEFREAVLASVADYRSRLDNPPDARSAAVLAEVTRIIESDPAGDLSLQRLGDAVGLSPGYLGKIFKASTGMNLVDFVADQRLTRAAKLLAESADDVQDIGRSVGFNSPAYFIKRFKERYGRTPYDYRRSLGG